MKFHGIAWDFMETSWNVMIFYGIRIELYVIACKFMDFHDIPWKFHKFQEIPRTSRNSVKSSWDSIHKAFKAFMEFHGIPSPSKISRKSQKCSRNVSGMSRGMSRECLRNAPGMSRNCPGNVLAMSRERSRYVPEMS